MKDKSKIAEYKVIIVRPTRLSGHPYGHEALLEALEGGWGVVSVGESQEDLYYVLGRFINE